MSQPAREQDEDRAITAGQVGPFDAAVEDDEPPAKPQVFRNQLRFTTREVSNRAEHRTTSDGFGHTSDGGADNLQRPFDDRLDPLPDPKHQQPPSCCFDSVVGVALKEHTSRQG